MKFIDRKIHFFLFVTLICMTTLVAPLAGAAAEKESLLESRILKVGVDAPRFTCASLDGGEFSLESLIGKKPVIIFFWSFFCGPCRDEMPVLESLHEELGRDKVALIGVNLDGEKLSKAITKFMGDSNLSFQAVFDELNGLEYKIADPYGVAGTPTLYAIGLDGKVIFSTVGHVDPEALKTTIRKDMSGT